MVAVRASLKLVFGVFDSLRNDAWLFLLVVAVLVAIMLCNFFAATFEKELFPEIILLIRQDSGKFIFETDK